MVVIKAKGTRNFVLSYFVPVVGVGVKGTIELGEFRHNCCACCAWYHNGLRVVTLLSVRGDTIICACWHYEGRPLRLPVLYLPGLARGCFLSISVPVVGTKVKGAMTSWGSWQGVRVIAFNHSG